MGHGPGHGPAQVLYTPSQKPTHLTSLLTPNPLCLLKVNKTTHSEICHFVPPPTASKQMKRNRWIYLSSHERTRERTKTQPKDSKKSDTTKKTSPTASNVSELIILILLRPYHSPKAINKNLSTAPTRNSCHRTHKKPWYVVAGVSTSPDSHATRGGRYNSIITSDSVPNLHPPPSPKESNSSSICCFLISLDERKLLGLLTPRTDV